MDKESRLGKFDKWGYKNSFSKGELARELTYMNRDYEKLEQQCKKQKEVIDKAIEYIRIYRSYQKIDNKDYLKGRDEIGCLDIYQVDELLDILNEVSE